MKKDLGVLCHISSLVGEFGIGDFGKSCFQFVDFLHQNNFNLWQILPLNKTNEFNCPYASICTYSKDEMYLSLDEYIENKQITLKDLSKLKRLSFSKKVKYSLVKKEKKALKHKL